MIDALFVLCQRVEDTTVLNRAGPEGLAYVRAKASEALALGGMTSAQGRRFIQTLDEDFSRRNLSPGGCADLLAAAVFLEMLSGEFRAQ
jgi:Triphosphoribosyl-dephospho-CoA synthetase